MRRFGQLQYLLAAVLFATGLAVVPAEAAPALPATAHTADLKPKPKLKTKRSDDSGPAARHDTSKPLRTLRAAKVKKPGPHPALPLLPRPSGAKVPDPVLQDSHPFRAKAAPVTTQFDGIGANNYAVRGTPSDSNASVGSTQIVETVNVAFAVYSKTGATILPPANNNAMWSGFGGPCETTNDGDPIVRWDTLANRWVFTQFANVSSVTGPYYQCVAVSTSPDATGTYHRYAFTYENFTQVELAMSGSSISPSRSRPVVGKQPTIRCGRY
ncbi:hypothetical protein, partial [Streptomyces regalis]|uniref:hypothetical protein n=1 Tax=Streptomyces regalis TaxID=68262 RepID=UPI000B1FA820